MAGPQTWDEAEAPEEEEDTGLKYPADPPSPGRLYLPGELDDSGAVAHAEDEELAADHTGTGAADQGG